jgi:hypothetical protein
VETLLNRETENKTRRGFWSEVKYFDDAVDFVQVMKLKSNVKANLRGNIKYMVCNDQQCLPRANVAFNVVLQ